MEKYPTAQRSSHAQMQNGPGDWLRVNQVVALYNIGRSTVFSLLKSGAIPSVSLKKPGNVRGIRLIPKSGVEFYLAGLALAQMRAPTGENVDGKEVL